MSRSFSDVLSYARCPKQFYYRVVRGIERIKRATYFDLGTYVHRLLKGVFTEQGLAAAFKELQAEIVSDGMLFEDERDEKLELLEQAADIVARYVDKYEEHSEWEILHVEENFEAFVELPDGNMETFTYTPDLIIRDGNGDVWVVDHKTTEDPVPREVPFADLQVLSYFAMVKKMYPETKGFIFNYLRKKIPTVPRLNKTGGLKVNDLNRVDTTAELLAELMRAEGLMEDSEHLARLQELEDEDRFFFRQHVYFDPDAAPEDIAWQDTIARMTLMRWSEEAGFFPRTFLAKGMGACSSCQYQSICYGSLLGHNTDMIEKEFYQERKKNV